jgi:hypothetical protein
MLGSLYCITLLQYEDDARYDGQDNAAHTKQKRNGSENNREDNRDINHYLSLLTL